MGTDPIQPLLIKTSIPMVISMLVQALYNIIDSLFVARIEEDALTAVSLAFSMQNLMIAVAIGTGVGFSALVSKSLGERNFEMANRAANNAIPLYALTYLLFLVMAFTMTEPFFEAQHASAKITQYGIDYMKTTDWAAVNLHFKSGHDRFDINHGWICAASRDIPRIKAPWREWVKEGHLTRSLLHHRLHVLGLYHYRLSFLTHRIAAFCRRHLRHNHQRCRFVRQCILRRCTYSDDVIIHHLQTDHFCLTTIRTDSHIVSICLHLCGKGIARHQGRHHKK